MDIFTYKIIYFMLALFIGFFVGYMLKKDNYEKKVQDEVYEYEKKFQDITKKLEIIKENFLESENRVEINRDLYNTQKKVIDNIKNNINSFKQKTISSQELEKDLDIQLENILEDIKKYENIAEKLKPQYQEIASYINENEEIVIKKELLEEELKTNEDKINALKAKSNTLHKELEDLQKLENEYSNINTKLSIKITQIKDKSNIVQNQTNEELSEILDSLKVKVINYKYKVEELEKNMNINKEEVGNFISQNGEEKFIDKLISKFFNFNKKDPK